MKPPLFAAGVIVGWWAHRERLWLREYMGENARNG